MARRKLTPEQREENRRRFWSGEAYRKYDPVAEGYGTADEWIATAEASAAGRGSFQRIDRDSSQQSRDLNLFGLVAMPNHVNDLKRVFRELMMKAHPDHGGSLERAKALNVAFDRLKEYY